MDIAPARTLSFCCEGCRSVYGILHSAGLEQFYDFRERGEPRRASARRFEEFDDPAFHEAYTRTLGAELHAVELFLEGIHCSACVWLVERISRVVSGVVEARLDLGRSALHVVWDSTQTTLSAVARGLDSLGYTPHASGAARGESDARRGDRALLLRIGVAGAAAGNVMLMAFALYSGAFSSMDPEYLALFRWSSLAIATPTVAWAGSTFFRGAWAALRTRSLHMDVPISIGILTGYAGGAVNTLRSSGEIYFDSLCTLIFLLLIGRWLQRRHHRAAATATDLLTALAPSTALVRDGSGTRRVPAAAVEAGAEVVIGSNERIPVDGVVSRGVSAIDASLLTGESIPVDVGIGDRVYAGTVNQMAELTVRVESAGQRTRLGRLMQSVESAQRERAPIVRLADRVAGYFVFLILGVAALTLIVWWQLDPSRAVDHVVALLVVTCPCALGMATPLAVSAALRRAARSGILFRGGEYVEALARPGLIVFDKTGTLTEGRMELVAFEGDEAVLPLVRAAEETSTHPIARAFQRAVPEPRTPVALTREPQSGGGVSANVNGRRLLVGSPGLVEAELGAVPTHALEFAEREARAGNTPVLVALDGVVVGAAAFGDRLRGDAKASLCRLAALGCRFAVLSGDHQKVVDAVAAELGVPLVTARGGFSPEMKLSAIRALRVGGESVFMVGDGVNDAAALSAATVGIAVHGGAEASFAAAGVFTTESGLSKIVEAIEGSRRTLRTIARGIACSLAYNVVGIGLAVTGVISPLMAAVLMPVSSLTVVSLALRAKSFSAGTQR